MNITLNIFAIIFVAIAIGCIFVMLLRENERLRHFMIGYMREYKKYQQLYYWEKDSKNDAYKCDGNHGVDYICHDPECWRKN